MDMIYVVRITTFLDNIFFFQTNKVLIKRAIPYVIRKDTKFILSLSYHSILYVEEKVHLILYHASSCLKEYIHIQPVVTFSIFEPRG